MFCSITWFYLISNFTSHLTRFHLRGNEIRYNSWDLTKQILCYGMRKWNAGCYFIDICFARYYLIVGFLFDQYLSKSDTVILFDLYVIPQITNCNLISSGRSMFNTIEMLYPISAQLKAKTHQNYYADDEIFL